MYSWDIFEDIIILEIETDIKVGMQNLSSCDQTEVCVGWIALSLSRPTSSNFNRLKLDKETSIDIFAYQFLCLSFLLLDLSQMYRQNIFKFLYVRNYYKLECLKKYTNI